MSQLSLLPSPDPRGYLDAGADISVCGRYRWRLWRTWDATLARLFVAMLNPSTADGRTDDNTIRKLVGFARRFGFGGLDVGNAYAWRATDPSALLALDAETAIGLGNDSYLDDMARQSARIVVAWGQNIRPARAADVEALLARHGDLWRLGSANANGTPRHPLYLPNATQLVLHRTRAA